ncbi:hypothetical protein FKM82_013826 [Ascaphus truei]
MTQPWRDRSCSLCWPTRNLMQRIWPIGLLMSTTMTLIEDMGWRWFTCSRRWPVESTGVCSHRPRSSLTAKGHTYAKTSGELTHASSLGYNGAILQALAVHFALQGEQSRETFLQHLLSHMHDVEADEKSRSDARELELEEFPYCSRLKKIREFLERGHVSRNDVVAELGNGIAALESVPTAIYAFLRCMDPVAELPSQYNSLQRTIAFCISLGGDTDTIATMAGAIAGAYHGEEQVPLSWKLCCEAHKDAESWGEQLHQLYSTRL